MNNELNLQLEKVKEYEANLFAYLENSHSDWLKRIEEGYFEESDMEALKNILKSLEK